MNNSKNFWDIYSKTGSLDIPKYTSILSIPLYKKNSKKQALKYFIFTDNKFLYFEVILIYYITF